MRRLVACGSYALAQSLCRQFWQERPNERVCHWSLLEVRVGEDVHHFAPAGEMALVQRFAGYEFNVLEIQGEVPEDVRCFLRTRVRPWAASAAPTATGAATTSPTSPAGRTASEQPAAAPASSTSRAPTSARWPSRVLQRLGREPRVGDWYAECCRLDLRQLATPEDVEDLRELYSDGDTGGGFWDSWEKADREVANCGVYLEPSEIQKRS